MTDEVAKIAEGLSDKQRRALLDAEPRRGSEELFLRSYRDRGRLADSIYSAGLASIVMRGVMLNDLGLAVRADDRDADRQCSDNCKERQSSLSEVAPIASKHCSKNTAVNLPRLSMFLMLGSESTTPTAASFSTS